MKLLKRGIILILLLILVNSVAASFLEINLTRNKVSLGQNFDGYMKFNLTKPAFQDSKFIFHVNEKTYDVKLENVLKNIKEVQVIPPEYKKEGASASTINVDFPKNDTKVNVALDLSARGRTPEGVVVNSLQFYITGEQLNGKLPSDVAIDLGNDKSKEYRYQSNIFKGYRTGDRSYLGDTSPDGSVFIRGGDVFCQKTTLTPSKRYQVKVQVASLVSGAQLGMSITENILSGIPDCTIEKCCTVNTISSTTNEARCTIEKEVPDESNYSICAYTLGEEYGTNYFKLSVDTDDTKISGYANGNERSEDYFIYTDYGEFDNTLSGTARVEIRPEAVNNYIQGGNCGNCLLIPLSISTKTAGRVKLSNVALGYEYDGVASELNSFQKINSIPERINYTKTVNIELLSLSNVVAPAEKRTDNELYSEIDTGEEKLTSNRVRFDSLEGPKPYIRYGPAPARAGTPITFDASNTTISRDREIEKYEWDFGDGGKAEGAEAKHTYVNASTYLVILKATDSEGLTGIDRIVITIIGDIGIDNEINSTLQTINNLKSKIEKGSAQLKDSAEQIGLNRLLSNAETNITQIRNNKDKILGNANLTETQKNQQLGSLINNLADIKQNIPADIIVDVTTFNPKALSLNDIPSEVADDTDTRKAILKSQSGVSVNGEARAINLLYADGRIENKIFVKKTISGTGTTYEVLPFGTAVEEVITPSEYNFTSSNVLKFSGSTSLSYIMEGVLFNALSTKTIVVPSALKVEKTEKEKLESTCGDNICDYSMEDNESCPEDCKAEKPLWLIGIIAFVVTLIVYFGLFFKGGLLNKLLIKKPGRNFFANEKDYLAVKNYVREAKKKGLKNKQIKEALKTKHWKEEQAKGVLNDIEVEEKRAKKIAEKLSKKR